MNGVNFTGLWPIPGNSQSRLLGGFSIKEIVLTTYTMRRWRSVPQLTILSFIRWLLGLKVPKDRLSRIDPLMGETPGDLIARAKEAGFRDCTDAMVDDTKGTISERPGFIIFPLGAGRRRILRAQVKGRMQEVPDSSFNFLDHPGQWMVVMVRPTKRKPKA